ncbi:MAG TPA: EAL domain-containing protein [Vicinamibacteria bacterium]|nr:EAL domain-containing protein [Vicinamibacteria bacterium]
MSGKDAGRLTTVKVPALFEAPFLRAQDYVRRYFADRVENPDAATISIAGERYVLLRAASLSVEFMELVTKLYQDQGEAEARSVANNLLFDLAHALGRADARAFQEKMGVTDPIERLSAGPVHFAFSGMAFVDISPESRPSPDDDYFLVYDHPFSFESHSWLAKGRRSDVPVCVMNAGYSSGWCEESFGVRLVAVEVECCAAGGEHCRFIMAPPSRIEAHLSRFPPRRTGSATESHAAPVVPEFFQRKRLEAELREANERLEQRVLQRTRELELATEQLRHQALHDSLTGLPNRVLLLDRLEQAILNMQRKHEPFSLLLLDLDGFKDVNDTYGHHVGDLLLAKVGIRLLAQLRDSDTIARLGGDEFAVLIGNVGSVADAERVAANLLLGLDQAIMVDGEPLAVGASIGIVHCPAHGADPATLLRRADVAMYAAKAGHAGMRSYDPGMDQHSPARMQLIAELRAGIDDRHLVLHYQPEVAVRDGTVVRVEALLRWRRGDGALLPPGEFLPLIESSELMDRVTRFVIGAAVRDCSAWRGAGLMPGVAVNLAPRNLRDPGLPGAVAQALVRHGLPADALMLEVTESGVFGDATLAAEVCGALRATGVGLSVDDFGTGYSSLMHLKHLPFTELKIDRAFTAGMITNEHDAAIVRSVIDLGHELGRTIVAEGVESEEVLDRLRAKGCDLVQGFHISRPLAEGELRAWLTARARQGSG